MGLFRDRINVKKVKVNWQKVHPVDCLNFSSAVKEVNLEGGRGGGGGGATSHTFSYLLNEIQMMISRLAKQSSRDLPVDLCIYYVLVICKFIDFMSLFRQL